MEQLNDAIPYEPLPQGKPLPSPDLSRLEETEWALQPDLDVFFIRIYKYWRGKGFFANTLQRAMNLVALLFLLLFTSFLMFFVNWNARRSDCDQDRGNCDILRLYLQNPMHSTKPSLWTALRVTYLTLFSLYWLGTLGVGLSELTSSWHIMLFCKQKLGISEEQIKWVSWAELVHRLVLIQKTTHLCLRRDLTEHDIVNRILRKENYLVGMINKGVLRLNLPLVGFKKRHLLTKMIEWSLRWGVLNPMFDHNFEIRRRYRSDPEFLTWRFRLLALANLLMAPFLLVFLVIYFLMMNIERFYHSPSTVAERSWSPYARWKLREFNELEHQLESRLAQSLKPAQEYVDQFPKYCLNHVGRMLSFVLESFVALLLGVALMDDSLLEHGELMGRNLVWWIAVLMIALRMARGVVSENAVLDPDTCLEAVVEHTHFYPKLWRGHGRSKEVQESFCNMFRYRALNLVDELMSIFLAPYILYFALPQSSDLIAQFLHRYTVRLEGVGDVCSLATFDFVRHGNKKYGSSYDGDKTIRSKQGKLEKSFLTFVGLYPTWQPPSDGQRMLENLHPFQDTSTQSTEEDNRVSVPQSQSRSCSSETRKKSSGRRSIEMSTHHISSSSMRNDLRPSIEDPHSNASRQSDLIHTSRPETSSCPVFTTPSAHALSHHAQQRYYVHNNEAFTGIFFR